MDFAQSVANDLRVDLPKAIVLDVGLLENNTWAVIEANGAWDQESTTVIRVLF